MESCLGGTPKYLLRSPLRFLLSYDWQLLLCIYIQLIFIFSWGQIILFHVKETFFLQLSHDQDWLAGWQDGHNTRTHTLGYSRKYLVSKQGDCGQGIFSGYWRKSMWKLQGSIKKVEFPVVIKIKWISIWVLIFVLGLSKQPSPRRMSHHNLAEFSRSETLFSLEFLSVKWQIWKFQWLFQKIRYRHQVGWHWFEQQWCDIEQSHLLIHGNVLNSV